jgi:hypothetical protein
MHAKNERSLGALVRDIGGNVDRLARAELGFVRASLRLRIETIGETSALYVAAAAAAIVAAVFVLLSGMFALASIMPPWLAALVVAAIPGAVAVALYLRGRSRHAWDAPPTTHDVLAGMKGDV